MSKSYILANFGGPRSLDEVQPFLEALLTDKDVIRSGLPQFIHNRLFGRIARKRAPKVAPEYEAMGGKSPIYEDTESVAASLRDSLNAPVYTFHRYIPATHADFVAQVSKITTDEIIVFPMFPQFSYATTGSIARWFEKQLPKDIVSRLRWVRSYSEDASFTGAYAELIKETIASKDVEEKDCCLLFSAHGIPKDFVDKGDLYKDECYKSFNGVRKHFPESHSVLAFQSLFGKGEWIRPYTTDIVQNIKEHADGRKHVFVVPIAFTSDHIETLCEIENDYLPPIRSAGLMAYRVPALNRRSGWVGSIPEIIKESTNISNNQMLIRRV